MQRRFTNLLCQDVEATAAFYETLFGLTRHFAADWFVLLVDPETPGFEFGLLDRAAEIVPKEGRAAPAGVILTFVVDDLTPCEERAIALGAPIIQPRTLMPYGQERLLIRDPEGTLVDISSPAGSPPA